MSEPIVLHDPQAGTTARISPAQGFNCYSFQARIGERPAEILWSHPDFLDGTQKPSRSGIPILFPFAGRIRGTEFSFAGQTYPLAVGDDFGNAIHGFVLNRPWRVIEQTDTAAKAVFQAQVDASEVLPSWPADFRIEVTYRLQANSLVMETRIDNPDQRPLPFWYGTHPYFRVPFVPGTSAEQYQVCVPAQQQWQLADMLPTGRVVPVAAHCDLRRPRPFVDLQVDDILTGLRFERGNCLATIEMLPADPSQPRHTLRVEFPSEFSECVVFVPPHREAICIEPYTSVSNAFELEAAGVRTGLRVLEPGATFQATTSIGVR